MMLDPFGMGDLGLLIPSGHAFSSSWKFVIETRGSTVLIILDVCHCHDVIGLCQVLGIDIVVTQLIDVLRVVVVVFGLEVALNYY